MNPKLKEWLGRYLPAEIFSYVLILISFWVVYLATKDDYLTAVIGTWVGFIGYYGLLTSRTIYASKVQIEENGRNYVTKDFKADLRNLLIEFGPATIIRFVIVTTPIIMAFFVSIFNDPGYGQLATTLLADYIVFYAIVIPSWEFVKRKKMMHLHHHNHN